MPRTRLLIATTSVALVLAASTAGADEGTLAEALFRDGREAMGRGDYEAACTKFRESHRLDPAPGTLLNLGECSEKLGRLASAWRAYTEATDRLSGDQRQAFARSKAAELAPRLPRARVQVTPVAVGCKVSLGGAKLTLEGARDPLPLDPGPATVELTCEGRSPSSASFVAEEGKTVEVALAPGPELPQEEGAAPPPQPDGRPSGISPVAVAGWVTGALGLASLGVGAALGGLAIDRKSTMDELCTGDDPPRCPAEGVDAASEGEAFATGSTVTIAAGAGLVALGATLLIVDAVTVSSGEKTATIQVGPGHLTLDVSF